MSIKSRMKCSEFRVQPADYSFYKLREHEREGKIVKTPDGLPKPQIERLKG